MMAEVKETGHAANRYEQKQGRHVCNLPLIESMNPKRFTLIVKSKNMSKPKFKKRKKVTRCSNEPEWQILVLCSTHGVQFNIQSQRDYRY